MPYTEWVENDQITIPINIQPRDGNGILVTTTYPYPYIVYLGQILSLQQNALSGNTHAIAIQSGQIATLQSQIATIPAPYLTPQISGQCLNSSLIQGIDVVLNLMVTAWCTFLGVIGTNANLNSAIATQCNNLNSATAFSGGQMAALTGWKSSPQTIADTITNQWLTLCDARVGISNALAAVTPNCAQIIFNYEVSLTNSNTVFAFYFNGYSFYPSGFVNGVGGNSSTIRIQDAAGNHFIQTIDPVALSNSQGPYTIPLSGSTLQSGSTYTITATSNVKNTNLGLTCVRSTIKVVSNTTNPGINVSEWPLPQSSCCPTIGTWNQSFLSGSTIAGSYTLISGLAFTPRYVSITSKSPYNYGLNPNINLNQIYLTYTIGGATLNFDSGGGWLAMSTGTMSYDWAAFP